MDEGKSAPRGMAGVEGRGPADGEALVLRNCPERLEFCAVVTRNYHGDARMKRGFR